MQIKIIGQTNNKKKYTEVDKDTEVQHQCENAGREEIE